MFSLLCLTNVRGSEYGTGLYVEVVHMPAEDHRDYSDRPALFIEVSTSLIFASVPANFTGTLAY